MKIIKLDWTKDFDDETLQKINTILNNHFIDKTKVLSKTELASKLYKLGVLKKENFAEINKELKKTLNTVFSIFHEMNIEHFPYAGTLLGLYRDKKIIEHDDDLDMAVNYNQIYEKFDEFKSLLKKNKFKISKNKRLIEEKINHVWMPFTRIERKDLTFVITIADFNFKFLPFCDLYPIWKFDNIDGFANLIKRFLDFFLYSRGPKLLNRQISLLEKRNSEFDIFPEEIHNDLIMYMEKLIEKSKKTPKPKKYDKKAYKRFLKLVKKNKGRYMCVFEFTYIFVMPIDSESFVSYEADGFKSFEFSNDINEYLRIFYGDDFMTVREYGHSHILKERNLIK